MKNGSVALRNRGVEDSLGSDMFDRFPYWNSSGSIAMVRSANAELTHNCLELKKLER